MLGHPLPVCLLTSGPRTSPSYAPVSCTGSCVAWPYDRQPPEGRATLSLAPCPQGPAQDLALSPCPPSVR